MLLSAVGAVVTSVHLLGCEQVVVGEKPFNSGEANHRESHGQMRGFMARSLMCGGVLLGGGFTVCSIHTMTHKSVGPAPTLEVCRTFPLT